MHVAIYTEDKSFVLYLSRTKYRASRKKKNRSQDPGRRNTITIGKRTIGPYPIDSDQLGLI